MSFTDTFLVKPGSRAKLSKRKPDSTAHFKSKEDAEEALEANRKRMDDLQFVLWAENKRSLLIVLQGIDASGKDGTVRHVMTGLDPSGCRVTSFKQPSAEEADHDFLWRIHKAVPAKGEIGVFNRSHYEEVLIVRVHKLLPEKVWRTRYEQINAFEKLLVGGGMTVVKIFLHISKDEQKERLEARLKDPTKNWKFSPQDIEERKRWADYMEAYEDAITKCSTEHAPWYVVPANKKWFRNLAVSQIIVDTMEEMSMKLPRPQFDASKYRIPD